MIESCMGYSDPTLLHLQEINLQILRHVHRQVMDHNPWYLSIIQSIVCHSKPLFFNLFSYRIQDCGSLDLHKSFLHPYHLSLHLQLIKTRHHVKCVQRNIFLCYNVSFLNQTPCITNIFSVGK